MPPVSAELDVEEMWWHLLRTALRYGMLETGYHDTLVFAHNHVINNNVTT